MLAYVPLFWACFASFWFVCIFWKPQNPPGCRGVNQAWLDRHRALTMAIVSAKVCMLAHDTAQRLHRVLVLVFPEPQNCPGCRGGVKRGWLNRRRAIISAEVCRLAHDTTQRLRRVLVLV